MVAGRTLGLPMDGAPLFAIQPCEWQTPDPADFDGILLGSANAIRHGGDDLEHWRGKPAYVVGQTTAAVAKEAGFSIAMTGTGGLQELVEILAGEKLHLLRLAAIDHVPLDLPDTITLETRIAYESRTLPMERELAARILPGSIVLLHSASAAGHFAHECDRLGIATGDLHLVTLGSRIDDAAVKALKPGTNWGSVRHSVHPDDTALLALAHQMCKTLR